MGVGYWWKRDAKLKRKITADHETRETAMLAEWTWPVWLLCAVIVTDVVVLTDLVVKEMHERRASAEPKRRMRSARSSSRQIPPLSDAAPSR
jgi:hypothetical protein